MEVQVLGAGDFFSAAGISGDKESVLLHEHLGEMELQNASRKHDNFVLARIISWIIYLLSV